MRQQTARRRLDRDEEVSLSRLAKAGDENARNLLVKCNHALVVQIARRYGGAMPLEDLVQEGVTGLMHATACFDPKKGTRFATYAAWWIRHAITKAVTDQAGEIRLPRHVQLRLRSIEKLSGYLCTRLGRKPTPEELATATGMKAEQVRRYFHLSRDPISLSLLRPDAEPTGDGGHGGPPRPAARQPEPAVIARNATTNVARCLGVLDHRERYAVSRRFGLFGNKAAPLRRIARDLSLTRERVRQIIRDALVKMRRSDLAASLRDYY